MADKDPNPMAMSSADSEQTRLADAAYSDFYR